MCPMSHIFDEKSNSEQTQKHKNKHKHTNPHTNSPKHMVFKNKAYAMLSVFQKVMMAPMTAPRLVLAVIVMQQEIVYCSQYHPMSKSSELTLKTIYRTVAYYDDLPV